MSSDEGRRRICLLSAGKSSIRSFRRLPPMRKERVFLTEGSLSGCSRRQTHQYSAFEESFVREDALKKYLLQTLAETGTQYPDEFQARIELQSVRGPEGIETAPFEIDYIRPNVMRLEEVPEVRLSVTRGTAEKQAYRLKKDRILVGRPAEVLDREGRIVRRNDIVFLESEDEAGASVGSSHARIWHDYEKRGFWIMDEGSRYGTRILRDGSVIEVPGDDPSGVQVRPGDDLYFGQAGIHFEIS